ncbi:hypothetical protein RBH94_11115 [Aestuariibaculum sp. YM273]|uniref:hypothetical protein n=1 Tax=Aestuariibaculum sp. YM273 TaxID=3070659 RepID=UPI0027DC45D7|nr:hypothetical protein [Aestuariibaculum sp. YM273]WMI64609.1 hypothetical protein RBH94_11115 [Aestuariibaculum sp. YM273]
MKHFLLLIISILFVSCGKEKSVLLPEVSHSKITEISDVSPAYLFYDITQKDSVELNRKNLISTTNWLVNIDKRLTLNQVIPHITFLQNKKKKASHKNKEARNYYTCNNTNKTTLGFIDFTDVEYIKTNKNSVNSLLHQDINSQFIFFSKTGELFIITPDLEPFIKETTKDHLFEDLRATYSSGSTISLRFSKDLTFQEYISIKSILENIAPEDLNIAHQEFIQD